MNRWAISTCPYGTKCIFTRKQECIRGQADEGGGGGHHAGAYPPGACHEDSVADVLDTFHFSFAEQVVDVRGEEDGIVVHDAEDGDEAYPDGDAEVVTEQALEPDAARNGRWNHGNEDEHRLRKAT